MEVETLSEQLHNRDVHVEDQNGIVTVDDLDHIQKVNRELEQQLSDKNRVSCFYVPILFPSSHSSSTAHPTKHRRAAGAYQRQGAPPPIVFVLTSYISIRHTHYADT